MGGIMLSSASLSARSSSAMPIWIAFLAAVVMMAATPAAAQAPWKPDKPVQFVVLSAPGGGNDKTARLMQRIWRESKWLENVVVLNRPGGGGALAYAYVSQQVGDAHFVAVVRKGLLTNHILGRSPLHYSELTPLAEMANEPGALAVRADSPIGSISDLAERLKAERQSITTSVGSTRGGPSHMMLVQLAKLAGADPRRLKVVTFSGSAESVTNVLGGHIEVMSSSVDAVVPHHKAGTMRILGLATAQRSATLPAVPTIREQGYDIVVGNWTAIMGPKGLTSAQVAFWEDLLERTFRHPAWKSMLEAEALEAEFRNSQRLREMLAQDYAREHQMLVELGMAK
jgi:putative tricarboxylic transport membrane protein